MVAIIIKMVMAERSGKKNGFTDVLQIIFFKSASNSSLDVTPNLMAACLNLG